MTFSTYFLGLGLVGIAGTISGTAFAQTCKTDADCVAGYLCKSETVTSVSVPPCAKDTVCDGTATTTTSTYSYCAPKPCVADSDCATGMICNSTTAEACTGGTSACKPGLACPAPVPPECTKVTTSFCAYRALLPCNTDNECGDGFNCHGVCSGSGGTATGGVSKPATGTAIGTGTGTAVDMPLPPVVDPISVPSVGGSIGVITVSGSGGATGGSAAGGSITVSGSGGATGVPGAGGATGIIPPTTTTVQTETTTCTTVIKYPGSCVPKITTCATDSDCPAPFICQGSRNSTTTTPVAPSGGATSVGPVDPMPTGAATAVTTVTTTTLIPPIQVKSCISPFSTYGTVGISDKGGITTPTNNRPETQDGSTGTETSVSTSTTTTGNGTKNPPSPGPTGTGGTTAESAKASGGCQLGHGGDGTLAGLSLLGLAALVSRRRRQD